MAEVHDLYPPVPYPKCPRCSALMRVAVIEPSLRKDEGDTITLDCRCGFICQQLGNLAKASRAVPTMMLVA
jgi:hypothetical protein